jgi:hypothetical protein
MNTRKEKTEPNFRDRLSADFIKGIEGKWREHGEEILEAMRKDNPTKFAEMVARLVPPDPVPVSPFANAQSLEDVGRKLLESVGLSEDLITDDLIEQALKAHQTLIDRLEEIAANRFNLDNDELPIILPSRN